jgi:hypothetical protein
MLRIKLGGFKWQYPLTISFRKPPVRSPPIPLIQFDAEHS